MALSFAIVCALLVWTCEYFRGREVWIVPHALLYPLIVVTLRLGSYLGVAVLLCMTPSRWPQPIAAVSVVLLSAAVVVISTYSNAFLAGYASKVRRDVDLIALQKWATLVVREPAFRDEPMVPVGKVPIKVRLASVVPATPSMEAHVKLAHGGHFVGFWGLRVGSERLTCPETRWQFMLAPGICVWMQDEGEYRGTD